MTSSKPTQNMSPDAKKLDNSGDNLLEDTKQPVTRPPFDDTLLTNSFDDQLRLVGDSILEKNTTDFSVEKQTVPKRIRKKKKAVLEDVEHIKSTEKVEKPTVYHRSKLYHFESSSKKIPSVGESNCDEEPSVSTNKRNEISFDGANRLDCPLIPPPPMSLASLPEDSTQAHASMMMSWYMAGYHTGYYAAIKKFKLGD